MRARVRGCIAERHLHIRLSRWETGQKKGQWPGMRAISEPLGGGGGTIQVSRSIVLVSGSSQVKTKRSCGSGRKGMMDKLSLSL